MKEKELIPLHKQPAYQSVAKEIEEIAAKLNENTTELERWRKRLVEQSEGAPAPSAVPKALAIVRGEAMESRTPEEEVRKLEGEQRWLRAAYAELSGTRDRVASELGSEMGRALKDKHIAAVKAVQQAVAQLVEANEAEQQIRMDLERLGYYGHGLQNMSFIQIGDPADTNGTPSYYYMKESSRYINTR